MMAFFRRGTPLDAEQAKLDRAEARFLAKRRQSKESRLNQLLDGKVPPRLRDTLDKAFVKAFDLIFSKATPVIDKTYNGDKARREYQVNSLAADGHPSRRNFRQFSRQANGSARINTAVSTTAGVGLGVLGIGIPDIALLVGTMLRGIHQIALQYGYEHDNDAERYFILLLIEGSAAHGERLDMIDADANAFIHHHALPNAYDASEQIHATASALSDEMLYMKFLQGIPIVGAIGGAFDAVYMHNLTAYARLKYRRRFLVNRRTP
ncbi:EcsC family protein [Bifidobacterium sp.]|jgi:hypothetical protein|uniref:EcsC family protein n=1 Tax=Bifidobacterium sp. TaxID=41200 RepID=UPI0025BB3ACB|nr:EcsC family protein [Bifidobacterium sp.]MCH4210070.1 EcsC family protein [Bifidobacterium sp.]MCI1225506.1 EcsC family protein [Bifidobacterium sp.]